MVCVCQWWQLLLNLRIAYNDQLTLYLEWDLATNKVNRKLLLVVEGAGRHQIHSYQAHIFYLKGILAFLTMCGYEVIELALVDQVFLLWIKDRAINFRVDL